MRKNKKNTVEKYRPPDYPPSTVTEVGEMYDICEGAIVCKHQGVEKVPMFNSTLYLENKSAIGYIDEVFGPINEVYFSVKTLDNIKADSFQKHDKFFIDPYRLLPLDRFTNPQPTSGRGGRGRGGRGGSRGGFRGGRGGSRGGFRGGFRGRDMRGGRSGFGFGGGYRGGKSTGFRGKSTGFRGGWR